MLTAKNVIHISELERDFGFVRDDRNESAIVSNIQHYKTDFGSFPSQGPQVSEEFDCEVFENTESDDICKEFYVQIMRFQEQCNKPQTAKNDVHQTEDGLNEFGIEENVRVNKIK